MSSLADTELAEEHVRFSCTTSYLETFIEAVESFRDEGRLTFTDDNVFSKVNDPANVGMCIARIKGQALNALEVNGSDQIEIGVNYERVTDCLSTVSSTSDIEVTWPVTSGAGNLMRLDVIDDDVEFEIPTLDPDSVPAIPNVDPLTHRSQVRVGGSELKKTVQRADTMTGSSGRGINFGTYEQTLRISCTDKTEGNFKKEFHNHDPSVDEGLGEHNTSISIDYLNDIKNIFTKGEIVTVHVKEDNPVRFDIELDDAGDAEVVYIIAPRLDAES
jgi:DNA polymerase III sliding clamp (beta) subunit (PCNA family)